jgi:aryl-alcohol dehydrogenase-like predicted oxidoreductase
MGRSEFFSEYLRIADGLLDVGKKQVFAVTDLVVERQEMIPLIRTRSERGITLPDTAELYGPLANDGLQMQAGVNEAGPIGALPAQI